MASKRKTLPSKLRAAEVPPAVTPPPAKRRTGRPIGSTNKFSVKEAAKYAQGGETPLAFLLRIMRSKPTPPPKLGDPFDPAHPYISDSDRMSAAIAAAPYMHSKMPQAMTHNIKNLPVLVVRRES